MGYYVRVNDDSTWDEIYDPNFATTFPTTEDANNWVKKHTNFSDYAKVLPAADEWLEYELYMENGGVRRSFDLITDDVSRPYDPDNDTVEDVIDFWVNHDSESVRYEDYKTWPKLYSLTSHIFDVLVYHDQDDYSKLYVSFSVYVPSDTPDHNQFEKEIKSVLKHITRKDEEGRLVIDVFDHKLSYRGDSVSILYDEVKDDWYVTSGYYCDPTKFDSIKKLFEYLRRYRYYD